MTAIAGVVGVPPAGTRENACRAALNALQLYGSRASVHSAGEAAFGVNLMQLVPEDRFDGQPYGNERFLLVADIRLDNRDEISAALGESAARCRGWSDAELLFHAWCRWQEGCIDRIVGDFAFAAHDGQSGKLFLVRDPLGQRPLFFAQRGESLCFASMPSGLLALGKHQHDRIGIAQRLAAQQDDSRLSYFEGIERVLSGEVVVLSGGRVTRQRWSPVTDELSGRTREDLANELRQTLDTAVAARLRRADGPVAAQLSSGYDSSAVTATAARLGGADGLIAFTSAPARGLQTVALRGRIADESELAAETARYLAIQHEVIRAERPLLASLRDHTRYYQEPVRNLLNMGWWGAIEQAAAERGARLLLIGEAGNLTFSAGGLTALADWVRKGQWRRWWTEALAANRRPDVRWRGILMSSFRLHLPKRASEELIRLFLGQGRWSSECFVRSELLDRLPEPEIFRPSTSAAERLRILQAFDAGVFRKGSLAKYGIDERDPTADRRLVEFSLRLPPEHLLEQGTYKPLARDVLAGQVPAAVIDAPLRGYQGADWISRIDSDDALAVTEEISANGTVAEVIDVPRLKRAISNWPGAAAARSGRSEGFGRHLTNALAMGVFILESEAPVAMGV